MNKSNTTTGSTVADVYSWLPHRVKPLISAGKLQVVQSVADLPDYLQWRGTALYHAAWHGSPHDHNKFDASKISAGEGAQFFGHGHYFTEEKRTAEGYRDRLSSIRSLSGQTTSLIAYKGNRVTNYSYKNPEATAAYYIGEYGREHAAGMLRFKGEEDAIPYIDKIQDSDIHVEKIGKLYLVELTPSQDEYLDWDKPLSEQSDTVKNALSSNKEFQAILNTNWEIKSMDDGEYHALFRDGEKYETFNDNREAEEFLLTQVSGEILYRNINRTFSDRSGKEASNYLLSVGIRGIRYQAAEGSSTNYVVFSDDDIHITAKYSRDLSGVEALYDERNDQLYLVADMLHHGNIQAVLSHELLHRAEAVDPKLKAALCRFDSRMRERFDLAGQSQGTAIEQAAYQRVMNAGTPVKDQLAEFKAYLVTEYHQAPENFFGTLLKIIQDFIAAIRAAILRAGMPLTNLTPADLNALSMYGVRAPQDQGAPNNPATINSESIFASAVAQGYHGNDADEALEWLTAKSQGLDMSHEAQMQRAKAMGFDVQNTWYHGATADIKAFDLSKAGSNDFCWHGKGIYLANSPKNAEPYSGYVEDLPQKNIDRKIERGISSNIIPVFVAGSIVKTTHQGARLENFDEADALVIDYQNGYEEMVVKNASKIRSIFAAFDPSYADSADLLVSKTDNYQADDIRFSFAGINAETADKSTLAKAVIMEQTGIDNEAIRQVTGWFLGFDNKWRFEIDDSSSELLIKPGHGQTELLSTVLKNDNLFIAYPFLRDLEVHFKDGLDDDYDGFYLPPSQYGAEHIEININAKAIKSILLHEIQHAIQNKEGFAQGGNQETVKSSIDGLIKSLEAMEFAPRRRVMDFAKAAKKVNDIKWKRNLLGMIDRWNRDPESITKFSEWFQRTIYAIPKKRSKHRHEVILQVVEEAKNNHLKKLYPHLSSLEAEMTLRKFVNDKAARKDELLENGKILRKFHQDFPAYEEKLRAHKRKTNHLKSSTEYVSDYRLYMRLAGEIEARDVESRMDYTDEQRNAIKPYDSQGIDKSDAIVMFHKGPSFSFLGPQAVTADQSHLAMAQQRISAGEDAEVVRQGTGWHQGIDKKWRFEISDKDASLVDDAWYEFGYISDGLKECPIRKMEGMLGDCLTKLGTIMAERLGYSEYMQPGLLHHPALFAAYPEAASIKVEIRECEAYPFKANGHFRPGYRNIYLEVNPALGGDALKALLHEIQHCIQAMENFAKGGSSDEFKFNSDASHAKQDLEVLRNLRAAPLRSLELALEELHALGWHQYSLEHLKWLRDIADEQSLMEFATTSLTPFEQYRRLAGEIEARNTEARAELTDAERRTTPPESTQDVASCDAIVKGDLYEEAASSPSL